MFYSDKYSIVTNTSGLLEGDKLVGYALGQYKLEHIIKKA